MSEIHLNVIKKYLTEQFEQFIDLSDVEGREECETAFLTRALAAFSISMLADIPAKEAGVSVIDGYHDNGIDAIHYVQKDKMLYLVQAKWSHKGNRSVEKGDVLKFLQGVRDLINTRWERFNEKVQSRRLEIEEPLFDANTRIMLVIVYSGQAVLSDEIEDDLSLFLQEMNDASDVISFKALKQSDVYNMIAQGAQGQPINTEVSLYNWGKIDSPYTAYYGYVAASDVAMWWHHYYPRLFAPNIRYFLGDTDVNKSIISTLENDPEKFWYYNNGITALCSTIKKKPMGGNNHNVSFFEMMGLRIVNGAQTVGAIAKAASMYPEQVAKALVPIRFIELKDSPPEFEKEVTRNTNNQNRVDKRDFVALDPEQERIREELALHEIIYIYKSGEVGHQRNVFDINEATIARACIQSSIELAVQAKREIGKLWDDTEKPPYKILFNASVNSLELWRSVLVLRIVEDTLAEERKLRTSSRERLCATHGNRFIAHLVYRCSMSIIQGSSNTSLNESEKQSIRAVTKEILEKLVAAIEQQYPDAYLASLFKNLSKCKVIYENHFA